MLGMEIIRADYQTEQLHGGTLGDVRLVTGTAESADGAKLPYRVVRKTQKKWERHRDPDSWRREYDLYNTDLRSFFTGAFRWPECYHSQINGDENEIQLWIEYADGVSGTDITADMYERAARELGRFHGRLHNAQGRTGNANACGRQLHRRNPNRRTKAALVCYICAALRHIAIRRYNRHRIGGRCG